jgi:hypothetical protein
MTIHCTHIKVADLLALLSNASHDDLIIHDVKIELERFDGRTPECLAKPYIAYLPA